MQKRPKCCNWQHPSCLDFWSITIPGSLTSEAAYVDQLMLRFTKLPREKAERVVAWWLRNAYRATLRPEHKDMPEGYRPPPEESAEA